MKKNFKDFLKKPLFYILKFITKPIKLQDIIIIGGHEGFDCNGGALYKYLIENKYNEKYKIVWMLKHEIPKNLPYNVEAISLHAKSIKKYLRICLAKYFFADDYIIRKVREDQISIYCTHGAFGLKNVSGFVDLNADKVDYILSLSKNMDDLMDKIYKIKGTRAKPLHLGFPFADIFYQKTDDEYKKITDKKFKKKIMWMPTFRKLGNKRNDSLEDFPLGIPLFKTHEMLDKLNQKLKENDVLLTIKIHPSQNPETLKDLKSMSNIIIIKPWEERKLNLDKYNMMKYTDALISDYSGASYEYLLLNRPIGFMVSDAKTYKIGFIVEDIYEWMPGNIIDTYDDFIEFIDDVIENNDKFYKERTKLLNYMYNYNDGENTKRLLKFLGI